MGLLDKILKRKEEIQEQKETIPQEQSSPYDIGLKLNEEGKLQVDFYDKKADFKQFYDTTRLIIDNEKTDMGQTPIKECRVSWYGKDDSVMYNKKGDEISRRTHYRDILADIDVGLLQTDYNYCIMVMKGLLNKERVEKYLEEGLKEEPEMPCGKYVGGVKVVDNKYRKCFEPHIGKKSHNSIEMINKRTRFREMQEARRQQKIKERQEKMAKLQNEIDDLSK